jgi:hypothetical protein
MKKIIFLMLFATLGWQQAVAQSFTFGSIKYNVTSPTTVEVGLQNQGLTGSIIIPAQVTYNSGTYSVNRIGSNAFKDFGGLTSVTIPNSVTSIGNLAFHYCTGLTSVTIPNSVISIGSSAFMGCTGLTFATIPNSVTSIGDFAFCYCNGLTSVTIPNSVTSIGAFTFNACFGLTSVTFPNAVTSIGNSAFYGCNGLTSVIIPNSVTSIGSSAFFNCSGLLSLTIPNSVTSIGDYAFQYCSGLTSVTVNWSTPLAINNTVFQNVNRPTVVLNVPNGKASLYEAASVWTDFIINETLDVTPFSATNGFNLIAYPNPSNNVFNFKIKGSNDETFSFIVFDMMGRQIENKVINAIDVKNITLGQNYSSGVYNVIVAQGGNTKSIRLVKE